MKMKRLILAVLGALGIFPTRLRTVHVARVCDAVDPFGFTPYRMSAGFPGDINRAHPFSVEADLICAATPPTLYGQPVLIDATTQGVRPMVAGDQGLTTVRGFTVRPYPLQQQTASLQGAQANFGAATPPATGVIDVLTAGYIMVVIPTGQSPIKGGPVFIWTAASAGPHVQGAIEGITGGGNTAALDTYRYTFNGSPDAAGNVEIKIGL